MKQDIPALYQKVVELRNNSRTGTPVEPHSDGILKSRMLQVLRESFECSDDIRLACLFWLMPESSPDLAKNSAPAFLNFLKDRQIQSPDDARAAAIAFGCGWRPGCPGLLEEAWDDAIYELALLAAPFVRQALKQLEKWGVDLDLNEQEDRNASVFLWSLQCAQALSGLIAQEGKTFGPKEGELAAFTDKDCSTIQCFSSELRSCLCGQAEIMADGFTQGLLWNALRKKAAHLPPPSHRCKEGWIRFTEQMAVCMSDDENRRNRTLAVPVGREDGQSASIPLDTLRAGERITQSKRIFRYDHHEEWPFFRETGTKFFLPPDFVNRKMTRPKGSSARPSNLWLRLNVRIISFDFQSNKYL